MRNRKVNISGTGCALIDFLFNNIDFNSEVFNKYRARKDGDGGLSPGKLVFSDELEKYSGESYKKILNRIVGSEKYYTFNVGGPSLVSLIHASQMLNPREFQINFHGVMGHDEAANKLKEILNRVPVNIDRYREIEGDTPFTFVFSDPNYNFGEGERVFINNLGVANDFAPRNLPNSFFNSDIICFGGTALVPKIHDKLGNLLFKAKQTNSLTVINTVFDFRNEKRNPGKPWPLINNPDEYRLIDVLLLDYEEALKISGKKSLDSAAKYFTTTGVSSFIITNGAKNILVWSDGRVFKKTGITEFPVLKKVVDDVKNNHDYKGDTTGCGDNFVGGIITSLALQIKAEKPGFYDMDHAVSWGVASGGFACYYLGGTYIESFPGEKRLKVMRLREEYLLQTKTHV